MSHSCKSVQLAQPNAQVCPLEFVQSAPPLVGVALAQARFAVSDERQKATAGSPSPSSVAIHRIAYFSPAKPTPHHERSHR